MKVLSTGTGTKVLKIIPREYVTTGTLTIRDDQTNSSVDYSVIPTTERNHLVISNNYTTALVNDHFYNLTLKNSSNDVIYRDKIFCTDQTTDKGGYTINENEYTTDTTFDNDFLILE